MGQHLLSMQLCKPALRTSGALAHYSTYSCFDSLLASCLTRRLPYGYSSSTPKFSFVCWSDFDTKHPFKGSVLKGLISRWWALKKWWCSWGYWPRDLDFDGLTMWQRHWHETGTFHHRALLEEVGYWVVFLRALAYPGLLAWFLAAICEHPLLPRVPTAITVWDFWNSK